MFFRSVGFCLLAVLFPPRVAFFLYCRRLSSDMSFISGTSRCVRVGCVCVVPRDMQRKRDTLFLRLLLCSRQFSIGCCVFLFYFCRCSLELHALLFPVCLRRLCPSVGAHYYYNSLFLLFLRCFCMDCIVVGFCHQQSPAPNTSINHSL